MRNLLALILSVFVTVNCWACGGYQQVPESAVDAALRSVVRLDIMAADGSRSGLCSGVAHRTIILTAAHCIHETDDILLVTFYQASTSVSAQIVAIDRKQDLAAIRLVGKEIGTIGRALANTPPNYGEQVVAIGHPLGELWHLSNGIVAFPQMRRESGQIVVHHTAEIAPGSSGGPLFNGYAEIVGINSYYFPSTGFGGATHLSAIEGFVGAIYADAPEGAFESSLSIGTYRR